MSLETKKIITMAHIRVPTAKLNTGGIDSTLRNMIRNNYEGVCNKSGFVKKINELVFVGEGTIVSGADGCPVTFPVAYSADVVQIKKDDLIFGTKIKMIEEFGIVCTKNGIVDIVIKSTDLPDDYESMFKVNDIITVRAQIDGEFTVLGNRIYTIGQLHWYTTHDSHDKVFKFLSKDAGEFGFSLKSKIKLVAGAKPAEKLEKFGVDHEFEEYKNKVGTSDKNYRRYRDALNPYELLSPTEGYQNMSGKKMVPKVNVISRAFFKMWEIIQTFPGLVSTESGKFVSAHLAEGPGGFIQATLMYREKHSKNHGQDRMFGITLPGKTGVPDFDKEFSKKYSRKLSVEYGDLSDPKAIKKYISHFSKMPADLVTGDAGFQFDVVGREYQEQVIQQLLFSQVLVALSIQKKGGNFVCKMFDAVTEPTVWILQLIASMYSTVSIFKPETSRPANSERYIIAETFKGISSAELKILHDLHAEWKKLDPSGGAKAAKFVTKFIGHKVPDSFARELEAFNKRLSGYQRDSFREITAAVELKTPITVEHFNRQEQIAREWCEKMNL